MTWLLLPGLRLARRDAEHLQLGLDPPRAAVLPDLPAVRRLVADLARGTPLGALDDVTARALDEVVRAELVLSSEHEAARREGLSRSIVHLDVPADLLAAALALVGAAGLRPTRIAAEATVALVWSEGELARDRLDAWVRSRTPHLVVAERPEGVRLGPYVVPGGTACLRCVDAHAGESDPRRALVLEQVATGPLLRPVRTDPALRSLALGWAVHDLAVAAEGGRPATWSATVELARLPPLVTAYGRHLHCGCAWADELASTG